MNEVIFVGERNNVMRCGMTTLHTAVRIEHKGILVAYNNGTVNRENLMITKVTENDGGKYSCTAVYESTNGQKVTNTTTLHINVHRSASRQCFRNVTRGTRYKEGDVLFMSCYCPMTRSCMWAETVVRSMRANTIGNEQTRIQESKTIIRIIVGQIKAEDREKRYDCFFGHSEQGRCSIGAMADSSKDVVLNQVHIMTMTTSIGTQFTPAGFRLNTAIIVIVAVVAIVSFIVFISLCFCRESKKKTNTKRKAGSDTNICCLWQRF